MKILPSLNFGVNFRARPFFFSSYSFITAQIGRFKDNVEYLQFEEIWCKLPWNHEFWPKLSENEILIYNNFVGNNRAFLLYLQRNTEVHKTLAQICICGTILIVAVLASLYDGNLSHSTFKSHNYSVPLRWILRTLWCK